MISHSIGVMYVSTPASTVHHCKVNSAWSRPCPCPPLGRAIAIWDKKAISNYRLHISQSICSQTCDIDRLFYSVGPLWDSVSPYILLYMELIATYKYMPCSFAKQECVVTLARITLRRAANPPKVLYLRNLMHPPTHLVCNDYLIANFLSFHMSLVVVMNCGAGNALRGFEISMFYLFLKLYFIHISKDILPLRELNAIKQCK